MGNQNLWRAAGNTEFDRFRREMDRLFDGFLGNTNTNIVTGRTANELTNVSPACELVENDKTFVIRAELPGCIDKDVDVQVTSNQITIRGEKKTDWDETKGNYHFTERSYGTYARTLTLPNAVDNTKVRARFDRGVLEIEMPKTVATTVTKVKVEQK